MSKNKFYSWIAHFKSLYYNYDITMIMKHIQKRLISIVFFCLILLFAIVFVRSEIFAQSSQNLSVTCVSDLPTKTVGSGVTWTATPTGGNGIYAYSWSGSSGLTASTQSFTWIYTTEGRQTAQVTVTSDGQTTTAQCPPVDIQLPKLTGWCSVISTINPDGSFILQYDSNIFNTTATSTKYSWSGTDGLSGNLPGVVKNYSNGSSSPGLKQANVTINSGTQTLNFHCGADVRPVPVVPQNSSQNFSASCKPVVNGMLVHWGVYPFFSGNGTTTFAWSGSDGLATTTPEFDILYTTEGTKSATVVANSGNQSMTLMCEARVASTTQNGAGHCFIATAAYGTPLEPEVVVLRHFRDETLSQFEAGKLAIKTYYAISPSIAEFIQDRESLKEIVRIGLEPIIYGLEKIGYQK